jgi:hypothetical protein
MTYYINAWLEKSEPYLTVNHRDTREVVLSVDKQELNDYIDEGLFDIKDLYSTDSTCQQDLIKELFLARCKCDMRNELRTLFEECKRQADCPERNQYNNVIKLGDFQQKNRKILDKTQKASVFCHF